MPRISIDGNQIDLPPGATVLDGTHLLGIPIPVLCFLAGFEHVTSCMVCVVEDTASGRLVPACSALAQDGMAIETTTDRCRTARKTALELLLSEHVGDCEAPCHRICPAHMNIPLMIRQIAAGDLRGATETVRQDIPFPSILGRICPAPCEKGCRRAQADGPVAICLLKRFVGDADLAAAEPVTPRQPASGHCVAVVGSGPAGLSAAHYLLLAGHEVTLFDEGAEAGGQLRTGVPRNRLPATVLDREIAIVKQLGGDWRQGTRVGQDVSVDELRSEFGALVLTPGEQGHAAIAAALRLDTTAKGIAIDRQTHATSIEGVFAGGAAVVPGKLAVRAVAHGKTIAAAVGQFLAGDPVTGEPRRFNSVMGRLSPEETRELQAMASPHGRHELEDPAAQGFSPATARAEAQRCLHCDCLKAETCTLRQYADEYGARQSRYPAAERPPFHRVRHPGGIVYEPAKCIKCGRCVRITRRAGERLGLTFIGRGFDVRVGVPFGEPLASGLETVARECVEACPTAALAFET